MSTIEAPIMSMVIIVTETFFSVDHCVSSWPASPPAVPFLAAFQKPVTIFLPADTSSLTSSNYTASQIRRVLTNHVVWGRYSSAQILSMPFQFQLPTADKSNLTIWHLPRLKSIFIRAASVIPTMLIKPDVVLEAYVALHGVSSVLLPANLES